MRIWSHGTASGKVHRKLRRPTQSVRDLHDACVKTSLGGALLSVSLLMAQPSLAFSPETETLFTNKCAACHTGGGNIVERGATLFTNDLERNGVNTTEEIFKARSRPHEPSPHQGAYNVAVTASTGYLRRQAQDAGLRAGVCAQG